MSVVEIDITRGDLQDSTWKGPVDWHPKTADIIQESLDRHGLDIHVGILDDDSKCVHLDVVPKAEKVDSSMLSNISYDETTQKLQVTFNSGSTYEYSNVEKSIFLGLKEAKSTGKFFLKHVRGHYVCKQID